LNAIYPVDKYSFRFLSEEDFIRARLKLKGFAQLKCKLMK